MSSPNPSQAKRQAVLVLGMHRSGTSALAGVIARLGAQLPKTQMRADITNSKGYGESSELAQLHDRLLASAGSGWRDWEPFDQNWMSSPFAAPFASELKRLIGTEFGDAPVFVVKDPRICRIVPFWLQQLEASNIEPRVILTVRNPIEVAASLERRDSLPVRPALLLWLRYMLDAEEATRGLPRGWVHFDDLLTDWRGSIERLGRALALDWQSKISNVEHEIDGFLSNELRHHAKFDEQLASRSDISEWIKDAYGVLADRQFLATDEASGLARLDEVRTNFNAACEAFRPLIATELRHCLGELEKIGRDLRRATAQAEKLSTRLSVANDKLARYRRVTFPIRWLRDAPGVLRDRFLALTRAEGVAQQGIRAISSPQQNIAAKPIEMSPGAANSEPEAQIAVVCHVYYLSLWDEIASEIRQIPAPFDLYVTIVSQEGATDLRGEIVGQFPRARIEIVANHGRDIVPFVSLLNSGALDHYYLICKIHTKKSPHRDDGDQWRRKIFFGLLDSPENVADILRAFNAHPELGLVVADGELYEGERGWKGNREQAVRVIDGLGLNLDDYPPRFVLASMFWARGTALRPLRLLNLSAESFEPECGALDGTMCHAIERLFSIFATAEGLAIKERANI